MKIPITIIDDVFDHPEEIVELSKTMEWAKHGIHPGLRSPELVGTHPELVDWILNTIFSTFFHDKKILHRITLEGISCSFQKVSTAVNDGLIHRDPMDITAIIYLSKDANCGTSIYRTNTNFIKDREAQDQRVGVFEKDVLDNTWEEPRKAVNSQYEKVASCSGAYNSMLVFNGTHPHKMDLQESDADERLTIILFLDGICAPNMQSRKQKFFL